ncbi:adenosylcobalamin-dependent ribonucleoside-diphosphate reductase [Candidatus Woesearchaeota archaeon]|nr:adenosylcobalamin-dependent ribonucleoside-diphosphate reductase [Candidatus Woesearchaeota archaeon]
MPLKILKRDGRQVDFVQQKIVEAIFAAARSIGGNDRALSEQLAEKVKISISEKFTTTNPTVEDIQDTIERILLEEHHLNTAKAFILYREKKAKLRNLKHAILGKMVDKRISLNALKILKERYLRKDDNGVIMETPEILFRRVAKTISQADKSYEVERADYKKTEEQFFQAMMNFDFVPSTPILMNAGTKLQNLHASYVLPIEDNLDCIYSSLKTSAFIHQSAGGTGFSFSKLRPKDDYISTTQGISSGPISFLHLYDKSTEIMKKGGKRRGANMAILRVDHPDILEFITSKEDPKSLVNFNISVGITKEFMDAVEKDKLYNLLNPRTKEVVRKLPAREVFDLLATMAWRNGEPGVIFIDKINDKNVLLELGEIEATSPCAEALLYPNEAICQAAINLANMIKDKKVDYDKLKEICALVVHFLDNCIDLTKYPTKEIEEATQVNRKIGVGIMGFADMLFHLQVPYDTDAGLEAAETVMKFINEETKKASAELSKDRGAFPNFKKSIFAEKYAEKGIKLRNATTTAIAPTGATSMIADVSSGIEPNFAISFIKRVMDGEDFLYVNKYFEQIAREREFYSEALMKSIANKISLKEFLEIPRDIRKVFVTSHEISPEYHVKMQAIFQKHCDNGVSKSVNLKYTSHKEDVLDIYKMAYKLGCKGITVYRHNSRADQVLTLER